MLQKVSKNPTAVQLALLVGAVLLLTVPFINKPFHQDDRDFIEFARASAEDISKIRIENYTYAGKLYAKHRNSHAPVTAAYLGTLLRLGAGESEALFHGAYLVFPLIGAVSMYFLARRFTRQPFAAALLLVFTPGFLVMSHMIMDNLAGLALGLAAMALYIYGVDRNDGRLLAAAGIALVITVLTAYQTATLLPAFVYYGFTVRPLNLKRFLPFIILGAGAILWFLAAYKIYGRLPAVSYKLRGQSIMTPARDYGIRPGTILVFVAGGSVFPFFAAIVFFRKKLNIIIGLIAMTLVSVLTIAFARTGSGDWPRTVQIILYTFAGAVMFYRVLAHARSKAGPVGPGRKDGRFLLVWCSSILAGYLLFQISYVSVRHLLLLFPPLVLVFIRETDELWQARQMVRKGFLAVTLALTLTVGLSAAIADYRSASVYPVIARDLRHQLDTQYPEAKTVYFRGEFGFRYYLEQQGFEILNDKTELKSGDLIIYSTLSSTSIHPWPEGSYQEILRMEPGDAFPVRIWNTWAGAGFYGDPMGSLPIAVSRDTLDRIAVYEFQNLQVLNNADV